MLHIQNCDGHSAGLESSAGLYKHFVKYVIYLSESDVFTNIYKSKFDKDNSMQIPITEHSNQLLNLNQSADLESGFSSTLRVQRRTF